MLGYQASYSDTSTPNEKTWDNTTANFKLYFSLNDFLLYDWFSQGLGTTESTNLIGRNSHLHRDLDRLNSYDLDRLNFAVKKLQIKIQNY